MALTNSCFKISVTESYRQDGNSDLLIRCAWRLMKLCVVCSMGYLPIYDDTAVVPNNFFFFFLLIVSLVLLVLVSGLVLALVLVLVSVVYGILHHHYYDYLSLSLLWFWLWVSSLYLHFLDFAWQSSCGIENYCWYSWAFFKVYLHWIGFVRCFFQGTPIDGRDTGCFRWRCYPGSKWRLLKRKII